MLVTNIIRMELSPPATASARLQRTRERLQSVALELFEKNGYDQTTAAEIASAAGVTEMTFFRHFATKDQLLLEDPYDPLLATIVKDQPGSSPLPRVVGAFRAAWSMLPEPETDLTRRRVRVVAHTPSLSAAIARNNARTEQVITDALIDEGTNPLLTRVATAAVLAAITAALLEWSRADEGSLGDAITTALDVLSASHD